MIREDKEGMDGSNAGADLMKREAGTDIRPSLNNFTDKPQISSTKAVNNPGITKKKIVTDGIGTAKIKAFSEAVKKAPKNPHDKKRYMSVGVGNGGKSIEQIHKTKRRTIDYVAIQQQKTNDTMADVNKNIVSIKQDITLGHIHHMLTVRCIVCHSPVCDGTKCIGFSRCRECGEKHPRANCPYYYTKTKLNQKKKLSAERKQLTETCVAKNIESCCYDHMLVSDNHGKGKCRFKKRMRRLIIWRSSLSGDNFVETVRKLFATRSTYEKFMVEYYRKHCSPNSKYREAVNNEYVRLFESENQLYVELNNITKRDQYLVNDILLPNHPRLKHQQVLDTDFAMKCCDTLSIDNNLNHSSYTILPRIGDVPFAKVFYIKRGVFGSKFESSLKSFLDYIGNNIGVCSKASKSGVSGLYCEAGYGFMAGHQNTSISNISGHRANLPFLRSQDFTTKIKEPAYLLEKNIIGTFRGVFGRQFPSNENIIYAMGMIKDVEKKVYKAMSYPTLDKNIFTLPGRAYRLAGNIESFYSGHDNGDGGSTIHRDNDDACTSDPVIPIIYIGDKQSRMHGYDLSVFEGRDGGRGIIIPTMSTDNICIVFINSRFPHGSLFSESKKHDHEGGVGLRIVPYVSRHAVSFAKLFNENRLNKRYILKQWKIAIKRLQEEDGEYDGSRHYVCYRRVIESIKGSS